MSAARSQFLIEIDGLKGAVSLDGIAAAAITPGAPSPQTIILRRGILVAALIALETFVRDRTAELLIRLARWPAQFKDLPQRLRDASLLHALTNLQSYALMLRRQGDDYETEIISQLRLMSANQGPSYGFTKFVSGDYTGNISDESIKGLLRIFQITDCWESFRQFSSEVGFGVPSVVEIMRNVVRNRHRSAHASGFSPAATDITGLSRDLLCLGMCFDAAMTVSIEQALGRWQEWAAGNLSWRDHLDLYFVDGKRPKLRVSRHHSKRALKVVEDIKAATALIPRGTTGRGAMVITRDESSRPVAWDFV
jgi:hypothetical protein